MDNCKDCGEYTKNGFRDHPWYAYDVEWDSDTTIFFNFKGSEYSVHPAFMCDRCGGLSDLLGGILSRCVSLYRKATQPPSGAASR